MNSRRLVGERVKKIFYLDYHCIWMYMYIHHHKKKKRGN